MFAGCYTTDDTQMRRRALFHDTLVARVTRCCPTPPHRAAVMRCRHARGLSSRIPEPALCAMTPCTCAPKNVEDSQLTLQLTTHLNFIAMSRRGGNGPTRQQQNQNMALQAQVVNSALALGGAQNIAMMTQVGNTTFAMAGLNGQTLMVHQGQANFNSLRF